MTWLFRSLYLRRFFKFLLIFCIYFIFVEVLIYFSKADLHYFTKNLYNVEGDYKYLKGKEIIRPSQNANLLYELIPNQTAVLKQVHPLETNFNKIDITINDIGLREAATPKKWQKEKTQILFLGGSYTFGATVRHEYTLPYLLETALNQKGYKVQVWNAGTSAYVMSQKITRAKELIPILQPDVILIQDTNRGRRAFFYKDRKAYLHYLRNPELFVENAPMMLFDFENSLHRFLVRHLRSYRLFVLLLNQLALIGHEGKDLGELPVRLMLRWGSEAERISERMKQSFLQSVSIPIVFYDPNTEIYCEMKLDAAARVNYFSICDNNRAKAKKAKEYYDIHPPSYVYESHGKQLAGALEKILKQKK